MRLYFLKMMIPKLRHGRFKFSLRFFMLLCVLSLMYYFVNIGTQQYRISDNISGQRFVYRSTNKRRNARSTTEDVVREYTWNNNKHGNASVKNESIEHRYMTNNDKLRNAAVRHETVKQGPISNNSTIKNDRNRNQHAVYEYLSKEYQIRKVEVRNQQAHHGWISTNDHSGAPCNIPVLDPWDETIRQFITSTPRSMCSNEDIYNFFYLDDKGFLQENKTALEKHGVTSPKCVYSAVLRQSGNDVRLDNAVEFTAPIFIPHQVFVVKCSEGESTIYQFVFANVIWDRDVQREEEIGYESDEQMSIIFIGLDSVSRSNAIRKLPMTYKYLTDDLGMYEFKGYMKVGLNTFPNIVPFFTGESADPDRRRKRTFIWQEEPMKSYVIHYSVDTINIPSLTPDKAGFQSRPIDYYYRMYDLTMSKVKPIIMESSLGSRSSSDKYFCYAKKDRILYQIDYFKRFMTKYSKRLKFGYFWNIQLSHDDFNTVGRADTPLYDLLKWMKTNGHMDRSIVFVGSDHGFRLGGASRSHLGRIENHMPFMTVRIPDVLLQKFPWVSENLRYNTDKLVTAYDMHETMKRAIYRNFTLVEPQNVGVSHAKRSIFEKIPEKRSCADAGIPERFCYCHESIAIGTNSQIVKTLAEVSIKHINRIIEHSSQLCETLELQRITNSRIVVSPERDHVDADPFGKGLISRFIKVYGRYTIMFTTSPNDGLFEMMLDYSKTDGRKGDEITVVGEPVRINKYGNQSYCVEDALLKQICLCYD